MRPIPLAVFIKALQPVLSAFSGSENREITEVCNNSAQVKPGSLFCAICGAKADGHDFLDEAVKQGAGGCVIHHSSVWQPPDPFFPVIRVSDSYFAWALLCEAMYEQPAAGMDVFAVTGTNGKTTSVYLLRRILRAAFPDEKCGLLSTVEYDTGEGPVSEAARTTPDALAFQQLFSRMKQHGCQRAAMELSSHGLHQHRTASLRFAGAIFTNLTGDHLDYHGDMDHYFQAKRILFTELLRESAPAVINVDNPYGERLFRELQDRRHPVWGITQQEHPLANVWIREKTLSSAGASFRLCSPWGDWQLKTVLAGDYNVCNAAETATLALAYGVPGKTICDTLAGPDIAPPGRLEAIDLPGEVRAFVDYAHTDDALTRVLTALRPLTRNRLITVFGCGGDRDRTKRPRMAAAAAGLSDQIIVTSDNPRTEDPLAIIREILPGIPSGKPFAVEADRAKAIRQAIRMAQPGDVILIAGKGHETYQEIQGIKHPFDDREIVRQSIEWSKP